MAERAIDEAGTIGGAGFNDKLLVIGDDTGFSEMLMDYSLDMAARMDYSIIAVNYRFIPKTRLRRLTGGEVREKEAELKKNVEEAAAVFAGKAAERGVGFESEARIGDLDCVARTMCRERGDIDLVLIEPEFVNEAAEGPRSVPAFVLAPNEC